ncbi:hypothetical protein REPUB_Repub11eG0031500 [Reevesia pubescens]
MGDTSFLLRLMAMVLLPTFVATLSLESPNNITTDQLALLALKSHVTHDPQNLLATNWSTSTSVCNWIGVTCGSDYQRVNALDLSGMGLTGTIPPHLGNLSFLARLNIRLNHFHGSLPMELANLFAVKYINFGENSFNGEIPSWFGSFTQLQSLFLYGNSFSGVIPSSLGSLSNLEHLLLYDNDLKGQIPIAIENLSNLKWLYLNDNQLSGHIPAVIFDHLPKLQYLYLSFNYLSGVIPTNLFKCQNLEIIIFTGNAIEGSVSQEIENLTRLKQLDLGWNNLKAHLLSAIFDHLPKLQYLDLSFNYLSGVIPTNLFKCQNLEIIIFTGNAFEGSVSQEIGNLTRLKQLDLGWNNLKGSIPSSIFNMSSLEMIELGHNKLFVNLSNDTFDHLPMLRVIGLSANQLSGTIPTSLFKCKHLKEILFGFSRLKGNVPIEIGNLTSLQKLNLQNNFLKGVIPSTIRHLTSLILLDLSSNKFTGRLPTLPPSMRWFLLLSNNKLDGEIPSSICNLSSIKVLDLSKNNLDGTIPECLGNLSRSLSHMNLYMNNFHGKIPGVLFPPKSCLLRSFRINGNQLEGPIPQSLVNCKDLEVLDLGKNNLNDTFPSWLGNLKNLQIFVLRSNRLYGHIANPEVATSFSHLRIIDLSDNDFGGYLPTKFFGNLHAIINGGKAEYMRFQYWNGDPYYEKSLFVTMKGLELEFRKIMTILTVIDFSNNRFNGQIPEIIGELHSLVVLNLSHNRLTGSIPSLLGNLSALESLDLSSNKLQGRIPGQLKNLGFLSALNLSQNNLTGPIPQGKQFDTFTNDSYIGNLGLCGFPLPKICGNDQDLNPSDPTKSDGDDDDAVNWKFSILMGYGCGVVLGLSMGYIVFTTGKPWWFIRIIERVQHKYVGRKRRRSGGRK